MVGTGRADDSPAVSVELDAFPSVNGSSCFGLVVQGVKEALDFRFGVFHGRSVAHDFREKPGWSHCQERSHGQDADRRPDGEIRAGDEATVKAISDRKIKDDYIERA